MTCSLIVDLRERLVLRHTAELNQITWKAHHMTTGDYAVLGPAGDILAIIERKSLADFGASIVDGRHNNKDKLVELRAKTGCRIIYIIEGEAFPSQTSLHARIPYSTIESAIFHLMMREGVSVIQTRDTLHTAATLARFVRSMDTLLVRDPGFSLKQGGADPVAAPNAEPAQGDAAPAPALTMLAERKAPSDLDTVRKMWGCFAGIGVDSADNFIGRWTLADIICGRIPRAEIVSFKTPTGRTISKKAANGLTGWDRAVEVKLLSAVPGVSVQAAKTLADQFTLAQLLAKTKAELAALQVNTRKFGPVRAEALLRCVNYRGPA